MILFVAFSCFTRFVLSVEEVEHHTEAESVEILKGLYVFRKRKSEDHPLLIFVESLSNTDAARNHICELHLYFLKLLSYFPPCSRSKEGLKA